MLYVAIVFSPCFSADVVVLVLCYVLCGSYLEREEINCDRVVYKSKTELKFVEPYGYKGFTSAISFSKTQTCGRG